LPFSVEDLARTALVRILPRSRYRLATQADARFQSFAGSTTRIAYRQQGPTPAFLLFAGPGQNPHAAATAAAAWAEANWRPNAIQRKVRPGVVVIHVAPGNQLTPAGPVAGAMVPAAVWTVDTATGKVETTGKPPGSPSASDVRNAASSLMRGVPAPSLGELDLAEKGVMQLRTTSMPGGFVGYGVRILLFIFALRYGLGGLVGIFTLPALLNGGASAVSFVTLQVVVSVFLLAGILLGAGLVFNFRNLAYTVPGFSSPAPGVRNLAWGAYIVAMIGLAVVYDGVIPTLERQTRANAVHGDFAHVTATVNDDGSEVFVATGGDLTVDLTGWPNDEWGGVTFKSSNPSVLKLMPDLTASPVTRPVATFHAEGSGVARVDATSRDGSYTFQLRVEVGSP
jgi:hypothetical protein